MGEVLHQRDEGEPPALHVSGAAQRLAIKDQVLGEEAEPSAADFRIEGAEDVEDARELMESIRRGGDRVGLVFCDHRLTGTSGVDFLTQLNSPSSDKEIRAIPKVLLTGQADHNDTIQAINAGGLHRYVPKPWNPEQLVEVVRDQLTEFVLQARDIDPLPYTAVLDGARLWQKWPTDLSSTDLGVNRVEFAA